MRVHEYAKLAGVETANVIRATQEHDTLEEKTAQSGLSETEIAVLNDYFGTAIPEQDQEPDQEQDAVNAAFGISEPAESPDLKREAAEVDAAFSVEDQEPMTKLIPMRRYACLGRRNKGDGPPTIKAVQVANDEGEAINKVCVRFMVDPSKYKFAVRKMEEIGVRKVKGIPVRNPDPIPNDTILESAV